MQMGYNRITVEFATATEFEDLRRELRRIIEKLDNIGLDCDDDFPLLFDLYQTIRHE